jgi:DNA polymerase III subunit delta'
MAVIQCHGMSGTNADFQPSGWPVYGHAWAVHFLQRTLQTAVGGLRHAYLFLGPPQVGKSTLARAFVQGLFCERSAERPCGVCRACQLLQHGNHPDFRVIQPTSGKEDALVVDRVGGTLKGVQATELIHEAALRPMEVRYKVFFIQDFHTATLTFANKLLKTLACSCLHGIGRASCRRLSAAVRCWNFAR